MDQGEFYLPCGIKNHQPSPISSFEVMEQREAFRFHTPSSLMVVGPYGCGKMVFTTKLLLDNLDSFERPPPQIRYC